jgi:hypothetical protein
MSPFLSESSTTKVGSQEFMSLHVDASANDYFHIPGI